MTSEEANDVEPYEIWWSDSVLVKANELARKTILEKITLDKLKLSFYNEGDLIGKS